MRLKTAWARCWRIGQVIACLAIAVLCYSFIPVRTGGLGETTHASLWACVTLAAMSLVYFKRSP